MTSRNPRKAEKVGQPLNVLSSSRVPIYHGPAPAKYNCFGTLLWSGEVSGAWTMKPTGCYLVCGTFLV